MEDTCSSAKNCLACAKNLRCGWCAGGGLELPHCALGDAFGPAQGQCGFWQQGYCTDTDGECKSDLSCEVCVRRKGCGYNRRRGACEVAAAAAGTLDQVTHNYRVCSSGSFEAEQAKHTEKGWATPEKAGPVADPYALLPSMPHIPDQTKPVATWFKAKDPPVELPRGCRSADDGRGPTPRNPNIDCKLGYAVADRDTAPNMAPLEFGANAK